MLDLVTSIASILEDFKNPETSCQHKKYSCERQLCGPIRWAIFLIGKKTLFCFHDV